MNLDDKLREILVWHETRSEMAVEAGGTDPTPKAIEKLHQAYQEAGYHQPVTTYDELLNVPKQHTDKILRVNGVIFMTGEEWYDRFRREYKMRVATDDDTEQDIMTAAKRASGL